MSRMPNPAPFPAELAPVAGNGTPHPSTSSIHDLPDELLARIFTVGADDVEASPDFEPRLSSLVPGRRFARSFTRVIQRICWRWHSIVLEKTNAHLWALYAQLNTQAQEDICSLLAKFKYDIRQSTSGGRCDLWIKLRASRAWLGWSSSEHRHFRFIDTAITLLTDHQDRLARFDLGSHDEAHLKHAFQLFLNRCPNCPRLVRKWAVKRR